MSEIAGFVRKKKAIINKTQDPVLTQALYDAALKKSKSSKIPLIVTVIGVTLVAYLAFRPKN